MISSLSGKLISIHQNKITLLLDHIGFEMLCPTAQSLTPNSTVQLYTYLHWSADHGPSLYGFERESEKNLFLLIIDTPGIGPKLGISILEQTNTDELITMIAQENSPALNKIKGLGAKKAEVLCAHLKDKVLKLAHNSPTLKNNPTLSAWNDLQETLSSLNYSPLEIKQTTTFLKESTKDQALPFDLLLRKALTVLAKK